MWGGPHSTQSSLKGGPPGRAAHCSLAFPPPSSLAPSCPAFFILWGFPALLLSHFGGLVEPWPSSWILDSMCAVALMRSLSPAALSAPAWLRVELGFGYCFRAVCPDLPPSTGGNEPGTLSRVWSSCPVYSISSLLQLCHTAGRSAHYKERCSPWETQSFKMQHSSKV